MRTGFALLMITGGILLVYSAFQTPPDPRLVLANVLGGRSPGFSLGEEGIRGGGRRNPPLPAPGYGGGVSPT